MGGKTVEEYKDLLEGILEDAKYNFNKLNDGLTHAGTIGIDRKKLVRAERGFRNIQTAIELFKQDND